MSLACKKHRIVCVLFWSQKGEVIRGWPSVRIRFLKHQNVGVSEFRIHRYPKTIDTLFQTDEPTLPESKARGSPVPKEYCSP